MKKLVALIAVCSGIAFGIGGGQALAAQPAVQGCFGETVAAHATTEGAGGGFGSFVAGIARDKSAEALGPGVGEEVQAIQAGDLSDADFANTCN